MLFVLVLVIGAILVFLSIVDASINLLSSASAVIIVILVLKSLLVNLYFGVRKKRLKGSLCMFGFTNDVVRTIALVIFLQSCARQIAHTDFLNLFCIALVAVFAGSMFLGGEIYSYLILCDTPNTERDWSPTMAGIMTVAFVLVSLIVIL